MKKDEIEQQPLNLPGGGKAIVDWCRPLWIHGADPRRPLRLEVTVTLRSPGSTGMPEGPELTELDNIAYKVTRLVRRRARAEHVMTVTGAGEQVLIFYVAARAGLLRRAPTREALDPALARLVAGEDLAIRVAWFDDPEWSRLLGIYAAHDPNRWKEDRALMVHMAKAGDAIHERRIVAHRAYFAQREQCRDFLQEVRKLRFKADGGPKALPDGRFVAVVERLEPTLTTWHLHPVVLSVKALVVQNGGTYDGWETELIPSLTPPPLVGPRPS